MSKDTNLFEDLKAQIQALAEGVARLESATLTKGEEGERPRYYAQTTLGGNAILWMDDGMRHWSPELQAAALDMHMGIHNAALRLRGGLLELSEFKS